MIFQKSGIHSRGEAREFLVEKEAGDEAPSKPRKKLPRALAALLRSPAKRRTSTPRATTL